MKSLLNILITCLVVLPASSLSAQLFINELMTDNTSTIADEQGSYEDWIEIYNAGPTAVDLGGYYFTDDLDASEYWQIPTTNSAITTIPAGGFLLLWADSDPEEGALHLDFKLSSGGESIVLKAPDGTTQIDALTFAALGSNISFGRTTDGGADLQEFIATTPGASNENPSTDLFFSVAINTQVQTISDDAVQYGNSSGGVLLDGFGMSITQSWSNQIIGLRFSDIDLPPGAVITEAYVQFTTKNPEDSTGPSVLQIKSETSGNAAPFEAINFNLSNRPMSTDSVIWTPDEWTLQGFAGPNQKTPNLASVIQQAIDAPDWMTGNALGLFITGTGERSANNFVSGFPPTIEIKAEILTPDAPVSGLLINEVAPNGTNYPDKNGKFSDWIEIYNTNDFPVSLGGLFLTDDINNLSKWQIGGIQDLPPNGYATIWADGDPETGGLHANFRLNKDGEKLLLVQALNNEFVIIDSTTYQAVPFKASTGRTTDGASDWIIFGAPTPLAANANAPSWVAPPVFSIGNGVFDTPQTVEMTHEDPAATIYYTTDGADPDQTANLYTTAVTVDHTQSLRAIAYKTGAAPSQIETKTYLFDASPNLPVLMITTDPDNLWDDEIGIYTVGTNGTVFGNCPGATIANYWQRWERPVHLTFYETTGETAFAVNGGVRISGNCSRSYALKSLNFYLRSNQYGDDNINYPLFPNREFDDYERLRLRNSGQDYRGTMLRDGTNQRILGGVMDVEYQSMQPTLVYINGEYWGIQNFREQYNPNYLERLHGVDKKEIELLKKPRYLTEIDEGDDIHYNAAYDFMDANDLSLDANFEYIKTQFEIDNFLDYWISNLYMSNSDWPANNLQLWRPGNENGRWRYMYVDTDITTNIYGNTSTSGDTWDRIGEVLDPTLTGWPNDNQATLPFRSMMENQAFRDEFIQRSCSFIELAFNEERVLPIIDAAANEIDGEIGAHLERWVFDNPFVDDYDLWLDNLSKYRNFWIERPAYFYQNLVDNFGLEETYELSFNYDATTNGDVFLHWKNMEIPYDYTGTYYAGLPIRATAVAKEGYVFSHWEETGDSTEVIEFIANEDATLTPIFVEETEPLATRELPEDTVIRLFPNPAKDELYLEAPDFAGSSITITIHNQLGQTVGIEKINTLSSLHTIDLEEMPDGFYYLVLGTKEDRFKTRKFVVRR